MWCCTCELFCFFFNDTATTEIYTLSLHDALPICRHPGNLGALGFFLFLPRMTANRATLLVLVGLYVVLGSRSEEHTSELQSRQYLVCRLLLEKKKTHTYITSPS